MQAIDEAREKAIVRKITWRIIPFVFFLYIISYLDRANIGYAALQMNAELALSSEAFGFISGIFFIGYFLFEVPSNVMLQKYGARVWIARILVSWGLLATLSAFVQNATQLYILRFLLGVAEAGFFPGIIVYLTLLVPLQGAGDDGGALHRRDPGLLHHRCAAEHMDHGQRALAELERLALDAVSRRPAGRGLRCRLLLQAHRQARTGALVDRG